MARLPQLGMRIQDGEFYVMAFVDSPYSPDVLDDVARRVLEAYQKVASGQEAGSVEIEGDVEVGENGGDHGGD